MSKCLACRAEKTFELKITKKIMSIASYINIYLYTHTHIYIYTIYIYIYIYIYIIYIYIIYIYIYTYGKYDEIKMIP